MNLRDTARVRQPTEAVEHRLGMIIDITHSTGSTAIKDLLLLFPTQESKRYAPDEIVLCTRTDDRQALVTAFTGACQALRDACRIAHDYDELLSSDVISLLLNTYITAGTHLGVSLDSAGLRTLSGIEQATS